MNRSIERKLRDGQRDGSSNRLLVQTSTICFTVATIGANHHPSTRPCFDIDCLRTCDKYLQVEQRICQCILCYIQFLQTSWKTDRHRQTDTQTRRRLSTCSSIRPFTRPITFVRPLQGVSFVFQFHDAISCAVTGHVLLHFHLRFHFVYWDK